MKNLTNIIRKHSSLKMIIRLEAVLGDITTKVYFENKVIERIANLVER